MRVIAANNNVFVLRDETPTEKDGLIIPDQAQVQTNQGEIVSVGRLVQDKGIIAKRKAIFNRHSGFSIEVDGVEYTVLKEQEIIGLL